MLFQPRTAKSAASDAAIARQSFVLVFNPSSGTGASEDRVQALTDTLRRRDVDALRIDSIDAALDEVRDRYAAGNLSAVVACGGDGTLNSLLNGTPAGLPLAVFPCGTSNLMAKRVRMPRDPLKAARVLISRKLKTFDCGRVGERLFLLMLSAGFDAAITHCLESHRHGPIRRLAHAWPIFRHVRKYDFPELRIIIDGAGGTPFTRNSRGREFTSRWCVIQNLPAYALLLNFTPRARGDDGLLDYCLFERPGLLNGLFFLYRVLLGRHRLLRDCHLGRCRRIHVETLNPEATVKVQIDGEPAGTLPVNVDIVPNRATLIVP